MRSSESVSHFEMVKFNSSEYFDTCWMKIDSRSTSSLLPSYDTSFVYDETESIVAGYVSALQSIFGTILNILVIYTTLRNNKLRNEYLTPSIISISLADLLFCMISLPIISLHFLLRDAPYLAGCSLHGFILYALWLCSAWNLFGVAILRYIAIYFPNKTDGKMFLRSCKLFPILAWVFPILQLMPTLIGEYGQFGLQCKILSCRFITVNRDGSRTNYDPHNTYGALVITIGLLMIILNVATYLQVAKLSKFISTRMSAIDAEKAAKISQRERKIGTMFGIITITFIIMYFLMSIMRLLIPNASITHTTGSIVCYLIAGSIGVIDPVVYMIFQKKIRNEVTKLFKPLYTPLKSIRKSSQNDVCLDTK